MTKKSNLGKSILGAVLLCVIALGVWIGYDNSRIAVKEQEIYIENLPQAFDGFRILQISDLNGKFFDKKQLKLIRAVNGLDYDMVAITGDMNAFPTDNIKESAAVLTLLNGMTNRELVFWVDGDTGPFALEAVGEAKTGELTEMGEILSAPEYGCKILREPYAIEREGERIWIVPRLSGAELERVYGSLDEAAAGGRENLTAMQAYREASQKWLEQLKNNGEVKILLNHHPLPAGLSEAEWQSQEQLDYDLILAGHNLGGQYRIPGYGAFFLRDPQTGKRVFFPRQSEVMGLTEVNGIPQYISAGLGAGHEIRILSFRIFIRPELNLITLRCS